MSSSHSDEDYWDHKRKVSELLRCKLPPVGWTCSRRTGHEGPCAAAPDAPAAQPVELRRLTAEENAQLHQAGRDAVESYNAERSIQPGKMTSPFSSEQPEPLTAEEIECVRQWLPSTIQPGRAIFVEYAKQLFAAAHRKAAAPAAQPVEPSDDARDAARYRWLNGPDSEWEPFDSAWLHRNDLYGQNPADLDAFIDAAIGATP